MFLEQLRILNYRNIQETELRLSPQLNLFVGLNGQGKTNIIEALHLLIEGESFRYGDLSTFIQENKPYSVLNTIIHNNSLDYQIQMNIHPKKKEILVNGKKTTQVNKYLPRVVLFSPESLSIIKESSDERRQIVDQLIEMTQIQGKNIITDFKKALRARNRILKDYRDEKIDRLTVQQTLESLNPIYLKFASAVTYLRLKSLNEIKNDVDLQLKKIDTKNNISFDFEYIISDQKVTDFSLENVQNLLSKRVLELASAELSSGVSLVGPQKHDVIFLYNGKDSRFFCSQGQQRSIILAFKMAQIVYHQKVHGFYPILLLDDVLSELDQNKQAALILALNEIQTQTFLTTTDVEVIGQLNMDQSQIFKVRDGNITR